MLSKVITSMRHQICSNRVENVVVGMFAKDDPFFSISNSTAGDELQPVPPVPPGMQAADKNCSPYLSAANEQSGLMQLRHRPLCVSKCFRRNFLPCVYGGITYHYVTRFPYCHFSLRFSEVRYSEK